MWARHKVDGQLYRLPDGEAKTRKAWAKEHLECFMPDCPDRRLTTVARHPRRRDGFSHYTGSGGHSAEGEAHQQAKAALVDWVQQALGGQGVRAVTEQASADRARVADVMVTWPDGRQVAFEVQYAALSVEQWRQRHESYTAQGITAVWLLGHAGRHLQAARRRSWDQGQKQEDAVAGLVALGDLHQAMIQAGVPLWWINPVWGHGDYEGAGIGTVAVSATPHRARGDSYGDGYDNGYDDHRGQDFPVEVPPGPRAGRAVFHADPLSACALTPEGLSSPTRRRLQAAAQELAAVNAERRRLDDQRAAREREAQRARQERRRAAAEARERRRLRERELARRAWEDSVLHGELVWSYGLVPQLLRLRLSSDSRDRADIGNGIHALSEHWRAAVYYHLIAGKIGRSFTLADAHRVILGEGITITSQKGPRAAGALTGWEEAVTGWLEKLHARGYVTVHHGLANRLVADSVQVLADLDHPPPSPPLAPPALAPPALAPPALAPPALAPPALAPPALAPPALAPPATPPSRRARASSHPQEPRRSNPQQHDPAGSTGSTDPDDLSTSNTQDLTAPADSIEPGMPGAARNQPPPTARPQLRCQGCGKPLNPLLADYGRHVLC
ncbi:competence protein CoiA family protein [Kineococcus rhizosphaerae]|uniref:Competence protein CoiA-like protein n=1 Tax=Kineococcus rhizosphaerae TaxID=559628 RepID=A0A2T0QSD1_9ACTN|nr:competence protein CoiA family protein [Kineococcus rhizosphaerae]PRY07900.1 competence protein CoiA-like protein [Kineococcus rhizosphaerae]